ncbi:MAG: tetratricopeptide repeat protein [Candidatus Electrothrix aestuarii]|uniref:Tetratricopeptide repeat protein n=1 Tax=Candidatus Electrothrix aestuarii TaxID=3062594 RepID=A0AAU8M1K3_9BACT|nr:tetratricopeptide repeat protein [Candidatus Electrothrix aestuarii]
MSTQQGVVKEGNIRSVNAGAIAAQLYEQLYKEGHQLDVKNEQVKSLTEAVTALSNLSKADASIEGINNALASLERGKTKQARSLFAGLLKRRIPKDQRGNKDAAALARHLGALAFLNDTQAALVAYRKAVQLDPDNAESWSRLGQVLYRTGQLDQAEEMYRNALEFNNALGCMGGMAKAITGLGNVAFTRSELDQAEQMYKKALEIDKALGLKAAMAQDYSSLGNVAFSRGDLDLAEERYKKGLVLDELFRTKENIAKTYDNLGRVYKARGELDKAEQMRRKAATLDDSYAMGNQFAQAEN